MLPVHYGLIGMAALALLIGLGVRIFVAAGVVGFVGLWALLGFTKAVGIAGHIPYSDTTNYALSVLPLFILIGHLAHHAGIVQGAFRCARVSRRCRARAPRQRPYSAASRFQSCCATNTIRALRPPWSRPAARSPR
jgi:hypothetical protein